MNDDWLKGFIGEGIKYTYGVRGFCLEMDRKLSDNEIMFLSNISISGHKFYEKCVEYDMNFSSDFLDKLNPIMKMVKRSETINKIIK